ncbi:MAG: hypothetical protein QOI38_507 [Sphingomonadales bacterium]|jgi:hypothetical protein|nr:hypothetical protein [Sphingomonadales bacterium]
MRTLATRFQLSDVGLKKVCTKHRIPVPGRGYWQRLQAGKQDRRIPLPVIAASPAITFTLRPPDEEQPVGPTAPDPAIEIEKSLPPVVVDESAARPHAVTRAMGQELRRKKPDDYGAIRCIEPDALPVRIHSGSTDRVLQIADALLKGSVARGFELWPGKKGGRFASGLQIVVDGEAFEISIEERMRREAHKPTEEEQARRRRGLFVYSRTYDYLPTGELTLKIDPCYGSGLQTTWRDTRHQRIEQRLTEVMVSLRRHAALRKAEREKAKRKAVRFEQEQQRRGELRARIEAERRAVTKLEQDAENWSRAERIRAFVAAAERREDGGDKLEQSDWVEWGRACADRLDPLCEGAPSLLDTPDSEVQPIALWQFKDTDGD